MYRVVGYFKDYVFVHDTRDDSCEMVLKSRFNNSGLKYQESVMYCDTNKLGMLYGFSSSDNGVFNKSLCYYYIKIRTPSFRLMNTVVFLNIKLIPRVICENGYTDIILLNIPILYSEGVRICNIELFNEFILRDHKKYRGIEIPQEMLSYLMKLKGGSPKPLFRAFDGFLSDRLEFIDTQSWYKAVEKDCVGSFQWE